MPVWMSERLSGIALLDQLLHLRQQLLHRRNVVRRAVDEDLAAARGDLHAELVFEHAQVFVVIPEEGVCAFVVQG